MLRDAPVAPVMNTFSLHQLALCLLAFCLATAFAAGYQEARQRVEELVFGKVLPEWSERYFRTMFKGCNYDQLLQIEQLVRPAGPNSRAFLRQPRLFVEVSEQEPYMVGGYVREGLQQDRYVKVKIHFERFNPDVFFGEIANNQMRLKLQEGFSEPRLELALATAIVTFGFELSNDPESLKLLEVLYTAGLADLRKHLGIDKQARLALRHKIIIAAVLLLVVAAISLIVWRIRRPKLQTGL